MELIVGLAGGGLLFAAQIPSGQFHQFHHKISSISQTAVFVHGAGGGGWEWDRWRVAFRRAGWRVVAKDLRPAPGGLAKTTFDDYVRQVESWAPKRGKVVLIGASMGGPLVLKAAEKVRPFAIVLVNAAPPDGIPGRKPNPPIVRWANGPLKDTRDSMPDSDERTILWAWKRWRDESGAVMDTLAHGIQVAAPQCPVLVMIGENDTDVPPALGEKTARRYHADVVRLPGASHVGPLMGRKAPEAAGRALGWLATKG